MRAKRLWWTFRSCLIRGNDKRVDYARKNGIYHHIGKNVYLQRGIIPLYSELISFGDNVIVARNVDFVTHDVIHVILNNIREREEYDISHSFSERIGCIEVCDNVFIGSNSVILYGVKIHSNVIIASGSVVVHDCEPDSVYAGVPARKVGTFQDYVNKRIQMEETNQWTVTKHNQRLTKEDINRAWETFTEKHRDERTI